MKKRFINSTRRALRLGWKNFYRESGLSFVAVFVLMITISIDVLLFLLSGVVEIIISDIEQKADITIDFQTTIPEERILELKEDLEDNFEVNNIEYISRDEAMTIFIQRFGDRRSLMESLEEVDNPFPASLNISADDSFVYREIADYLERDHGGMIYSIDFANREEIIAGIFTATENIRRGGLIVAIILSIVAISLVYNTIKLAIYGLREEIKVMRLVGSSNLFIRSSFIVQGALVGCFAAFTSLVALSLLGFLIPQTYNITLEVNLYEYFLEMLPIVVALQFAIGFLMGVGSSLVVVGRYLK